MEIVNSINDALWSYVITIVLVGAAIYFTVRSRGKPGIVLADAAHSLPARRGGPGLCSLTLRIPFPLAAGALARCGASDRHLPPLAADVFVKGEVSD